jgi:hypothetical protein
LARKASASSVGDFTSSIVPARVVDSQLVQIGTFAPVHGPTTPFAAHSGRDESAECRHERGIS